MNDEAFDRAVTYLCGQISTVFNDVVWHLIVRMRPFTQIMAGNLRFFDAIFGAPRSPSCK